MATATAMATAIIVMREPQINKVVDFMEEKLPPIYVTQPSLPDKELFFDSISKIWSNKFLTNNGDFHQQFEKRLAAYLGVKYISVFNNGTQGLLTALQALDIRGEVVTTPYSFVATANSIIWNQCQPVFCDVDPIFGNIDALKLESLITDKTTAIMPVHVYGNPADVLQIEEIANKHNLKVIYDAAHAFGVKVNGNSVLNFGDLSVLSFHATKVFNTIEGGAIVSHSAEMKERIDQLKNFGITDEVTVESPGVNGKMNEVIAAYGLLQLDAIDLMIKRRSNVAKIYDEFLSTVDGVRVLKQDNNVNYNFAYYPIFIDERIVGKSRDEVYEELKTYQVFTRRYFYPLISNFDIYSSLPTASITNLTVANELADQVLCLPMYSDMTSSDINRVLKAFKKIID